MTQLTDQELGQLLGALESSAPSLRTEQLARSVADRSRLDPVLARPSLDLLISLSEARLFHDVPVDRVLDELKADSLARLPHLAPKVGWDEFGKLLRRMLAAPPLVISTKALRVMVAHEHVFQRAQVLTDLRPVFTEDVPGQAPAGVVVHTLRLEYVDGGNKREFFLALDHSDVRALRAALDRADAKADSIAKQFSRGDFILLGDAS